MHCEQVKQLLDNLEWPGFIAEDSEIARHLQGCEDCRDYHCEHQLAGLLADLPVAEPSPGFEDRVLQHALGSTPSSNTRVHARWALAAAASVVLAVFLTVQFYPAGIYTPPLADQAVADQAAIAVSLQPGQTRMVDILLASPRDLADAEIIVHLDDNLQLDGYAGTRGLRWQTTLKSGSNKLSLPVQLLTAESGKITVTVEHGGARKQLLLLIEAQAAVHDNHLSMS